MQKLFDYFSEVKMAERNGYSANIKLEDWLFLELLGLIAIVPVVGTIIFLILYGVLGFKKETADSMSSFIKLNLIISLIIFAAVFVIGAFIGGLSALFGLL